MKARIHLLGKILLRFILLLLAVIGLCRFIDSALGPDRLADFQAVDTGRAQTLILMSGNLTQGFGSRADALDGDLYWEGLQGTVRLLELANPEIAGWLIDLHDRKRIVYNFRIPLDHPAYAGTLAFQSPVVPYLLLAPGFWEESDLDKAAILVHEYRHTRQNFAKTMAERGWQLLTLKVLYAPDDNRLEDEAYLYQYGFYRAFGMKPPWLEYLLRQRALI